MSSQSPRASFSGASSSAEVAADFEESLKDLHQNNRYEISNLTIIAKENTEHAQAISKALENHIKTTAPSRKLPALFVLDSIVKNVGTPYTVYLGRNLYSIFMDAYTLVDTNTRRNMEGMLKTWKEPVPGSIDHRPVFPADTVRPIENALIKAKTAFLNSRQPQTGHRNTATPPQHNAQFATPPQQAIPQVHGAYHHHQPTPQQYQYPSAAPSQQPPQGVDSTRRDIEALIPRFQQKIASVPHDFGLQNQLGALQALHGLLGSQNFSQNELQDIQNQVSRLSATLQPQLPLQPTPQPPAPAPQWQPHIPVAYSQPYQPLPQAHPMAPTLPQQPPAAPPTLTPDALNGLQALLANVQKPSTPQMRAAVPGFRDASHSQLHTIQTHTVAPAVNGTADLLASLTKAGLINPAASSTPMPIAASLPTAAPPLDPTSSLLKSLQSVLPPSQAGTPSQMTLQPAIGAGKIPASAASLKVFRPDLVHALYDAQSNQCNTCGRRFLMTEKGREKKSRHLDWHFRTNQRIADPNTNRGHHRNWFIDEMDWIRHTEFDPSTTTAEVVDVEATAKPKKGPQDQFVRAPAGMTKNNCSICQEEMKSTYSEDLQDWIFANGAMYNGNRIVHATCLAEMMTPAPAGNSLAAALASVGGQRERSATPDSLLGKRKAESAITSGAVRVRTEY